MKRLALFVGFLVVGFLGLLACSDASGQANETPKPVPVAKSAAAPTIGANWTVDKTKSSLSFSGSQSGEVFTGTFGSFDAVINFDPDNLGNANVVVTIDTNSADAGEAERTDALPGKEWFYVKKFPLAKFIAADFKHLGGDNYQASGNLTIRDITTKIVLPFTLKLDNTRAVMDAKLTLNRTAYKIGTGMWASADWVGHDIAVNIHVEADQDMQAGVETAQ